MYIYICMYEYINEYVFICIYLNVCVHIYIYCERGSHQQLKFPNLAPLAFPSECRSLSQVARLGTVGTKGSAPQSACKGVGLDTT